MSLGSKPAHQEHLPPLSQEPEETSLLNHGHAVVGLLEGSTVLKAYSKVLRLGAGGGRKDFLVSEDDTRKEIYFLLPRKTL